MRIQNTIPKMFGKVGEVGISQTSDNILAGCIASDIVYSDKLLITNNNLFVNDVLMRFPRFLSATPWETSEIDNYFGTLYYNDIDLQYNIEDQYSNGEDAYQFYQSSHGDSVTYDSKDGLDGIEFYGPQRNLSLQESIHTAFVAARRFIDKDVGTFFWGDNDYYQLGKYVGFVGSTSKSHEVYSPIQTTIPSGWKSFSSCNETSQQDYKGTLLVKEDGTLWGVGNPLYVSDSFTNAKSSFSFSYQQLGTLATWKDTANTNSDKVLLLNNNGSLWALGSSTNFGTGVASVTFSTFTQIHSGKSWVSIIGAGTDSCCLKASDGTFWYWGENSSRELGNGGSTDVSSISQMTSGTWKKIVFGSQRNWWLSESNQWYGTGYEDAYGSTGTGANNLAFVVSPTLVKGNFINENWLNIAGGQTSCVALKSDGTLWAVGYLKPMALYRSALQMIDGVTNWTKIESNGRSFYALRTDGTLWTWGTNNDFLFDATPSNFTLINYSYPVQVDYSNRWSDIKVMLSTYVTGIIGVKQ